MLWNALAARHIVGLGVGRATRNTHRSNTTYLTTVIRVPQPIAQVIARSTRELESRGGKGHFLYPPESLHVTALNLDPIASRIGDPDYLASLAEEIKKCSPISMRLTGMNISDATLFATAEASDGGLAALRARLRIAVGLPPSSGALAARRNELGAANVLRFGDGPVAPVVRWAVQRRGLPLGAWRADHVELVETNKTFAPEATRVLAVFPLAGHQAR
ncbi:hypothetical protein LRS13_25115 [Svornostia abyssi]|uniref:Protein kinase A anchor protein nuclear localisation signal domain-containing protein n=1 Tax=Svornostia abyssi TaxID=2898438 RepID=A0ABY5PGW0_9ACTN|nr:hypothetical protein LRS13_25115 [Parviterribacteraceae bacterium J379]